VKLQTFSLWVLHGCEGFTCRRKSGEPPGTPLSRRMREPQGSSGRSREDKKVLTVSEAHSKNLTHLPHSAHCAHFSGYRGSFPGAEPSAREVNHSFPSSAEVKNEWSYASNSWLGHRKREKVPEPSQCFIHLIYEHSRSAAIHWLINIKVCLSVATFCFVPEGRHDIVECKYGVNCWCIIRTSHCKCRCDRQINVQQY
jgi:hypothetical protein